MRTAVIMRYIGVVILINALFMFISAGISFMYGADSSFSSLMLSAILTAALGGFPLIFVGKTDSLNMKEGYAIVVGSWFVASFVGMFPYLLWGGEFTLPTAWFESVSGFTTTGATALRDIDHLPHGLLFWRSSTHWLGGIGVVMFALVIMPMLGRTKLTLSSVELSPLARENYQYSANKIIRILLSLYVGMTALETVLLKTAGMGWFDAVNHSFSTIATGGFSTHQLSIGSYDNVWIELIVMFFMLLAGMHFGLIFATITGKKNNIFRSEVARFYLIIVAISGMIVAASIFYNGNYDTFGESVRYAYFQVAASITTTGFVTADANLWTPLAILILIYLMLQCACAGSTSGGIKSDRILLSFKTIRAKIVQQQHPHAIIRIKLNGKTQEEPLVNFAILFIVMYLGIVLVGSVVLAATGLDLRTSVSMSVSCMGNIGPGFGQVSSYNDYAAMSPFVKTFSTLLMLLGRLEIFGLVQLFLLKWWK